MKFLVSWHIEIDAASPVEAARAAWAEMRAPMSAANVFMVNDALGGESQVVDLEAVCAALPSRDAAPSATRRTARPALRVVK